MLRRLALVALTLVAALGISSRACAADPDAQWFYAPTTSDGPAAIFVDWTFSSVVLRAHCDLGSGEIIFIAPESSQFKAPRRMALVLDDRAFQMPTKRLDAAQRMKLSTTAEHALVGRLKLSPALKAAIVSVSRVDFEVPNDMGEPWHLGVAKPLRQVLEACGSAKLKR